MQRLSFFLAFTGLIAMYGSTFLAPQKAQLSSIGPEDVGEKVKVSGTVKNPSGSQHFFFKLSNNKSSIQAVKFDSTPGFKEGEKVTVTGEVTMYKGSKEIIVSKIRPQ